VNVIEGDEGYIFLKKKEKNIPSLREEQGWV
jgi:hypothetical protein